MPKRFLILTSDAGSGHRSAAQAIEAACKATLGRRASVETCNAFQQPGAPSELAWYEEFYKTWLQRLPILYHIGYALSELPPLAAMMRRDMRRRIGPLLRQVVAERQPDVVISVYPLLTDVVASVIEPERRPRLMSVVTDLGPVHRCWFTAADDCCAVPTPLAFHKAVRCGLDERRVVATGLPVNPRFGRAPADLGALREKLGWERDLPALLLLGGGAGVGQIAELADAIDTAGLPLQMAVVAGNNEELSQQLRGRDWHIPVHLYDFVKLPNLIHAADMICTKAGGLTVSESLAAGKPLLIHSVPPGQEAGNLQYVQALGAGCWTPDAPTLVAQVRRWMERPDELAEVGEAARRLGHPEAAERIARLAWELVAGDEAEPAAPEEIDLQQHAYAQPDEMEVEVIRESEEQPRALEAGA
ncbi:MAG TPA: glycosyltransferase [Roseiflexaceae bacterium]|nr:glycosyltransferase [Roseiflexaceae bacterium]